MDAPSNAENIGMCIRAGYLEAGYNRRTFPKKLGVDYKTVFNSEKGVKKPSAESLLAAAELLGKSLDDLLKMPAPADGGRPKHESPKPGHEKAADRIWQEFLVTDARLVALFSPEELAEIRSIRFRSGAPSSPSFYRFIAQAKLEHRAGRDIVEALDAEDITPAVNPGDSLSLDRPKKKR